jgi:hypothetical protein
MKEHEAGQLEEINEKELSNLYSSASYPMGTRDSFPGGKAARG